MSEITLRYNKKTLSINPGWIHEIMFLIIREFERDSNLILRYNLQELINDYKYYYSVAGDIFDNPTDFDDIFEAEPELHLVFVKTLEKIKNKLRTENGFLTLQELDDNVDNGIIRYEINIERLIDKINEVEALLEK